LLHFVTASDTKAGVVERGSVVLRRFLFLGFVVRPYNTLNYRCCLYINNHAYHHVGCFLFLVFVPSTCLIFYYFNLSISNFKALNISLAIFLLLLNILTVLSSPISLAIGKYLSHKSIINLYLF